MVDFSECILEIKQCYHNRSLFTRLSGVFFSFFFDGKRCHLCFNPEICGLDLFGCTSRKPRCFSCTQWRGFLKWLTIVFLANLECKNCSSGSCCCFLSVTEMRSFKERHKCPCSYYSNSSATFHCLLVGDLVFKLNPGPTNTCETSSTSRACRLGLSRTPLPVQSRNPSNLVMINRAPFIRNANQLMSLCLFNSRSVRNKTADIYDYVCECRADLIAITET